MDSSSGSSIVAGCIALSTCPAINNINPTVESTLIFSINRKTIPAAHIAMECENMSGFSVSTRPSHRTLKESSETVCLEIKVPVKR